MQRDQMKTKYYHYILIVKQEHLWPAGCQCKKVQSNMVNTVSSLLYLISPA